MGRLPNFVMKTIGLAALTALCASCSEGAKTDAAAADMGGATDAAAAENVPAAKLTPEAPEGAGASAAGLPIKPGYYADDFEDCASATNSLEGLFFTPTAIEFNNPPMRLDLVKISKLGKDFIVREATGAQDGDGQNFMTTKYRIVSPDSFGRALGAEDGKTFEQEQLFKYCAPHAPPGWE